MVDLVTEQNVLAVMNLRTGAILWRKLLADANLDQLRSDAGQLFTAQGTTISCWDMKHGELPVCPLSRVSQTDPLSQALSYGKRSKAN